MNQRGDQAKRNWNTVIGFGFAENHDRLCVQRIDMGSGKA
ncbi:hypothetical protein J2X44_000635 [Sphingopyxis sp. BE259]|nr:hypothetical protein [Sphingopyxis sp. BE122]MDR7226099.1 hypothetical protein [Sphingopyxis sp. BE259]